MSKRLLMPVLVAVWLAAPAATALARDRNHDGLPDRWERRHGLSTTRPVARRDPDRDGLTNRREYRLRTNPRRRDTDRDGLGDGAEVKRYRTNPRRRDTDRDGLRDGAEVKRYHTNPRKRDTDRDGLGDGAEVKRYHTNPRKRDTDGDGYSDGVEVRLGTDPRNKASHPSASKAPVPPAAPGAPPTPANTGVPAGWTPAQTRTSDLTVTQAGAVVQDILLKNADLIIDAPNVTVRRVEMQGGRIENWVGPNCQNGLLVEDSTFAPPPGQNYSTDSEGATGTGGYTALRVKIWRREEGFRDGGKSGGCGPVHIEDSFASIAIPPGCPGDPHSDGIQGFDGPPLTVENVTIDFREADCGTAPFFVPDQQGNTTANVNGLLVMGGGATFRDGVPGSVRGLKIVDGSWYYFPVDVKCSALSAWDAELVRIDANYRITGTAGRQPCSGSD
jgi:hypothetical protein